VFELVGEVGVVPGEVGTNQEGYRPVSIWLADGLGLLSGSADAVTYLPDAQRRDQPCEENPTDSGQKESHSEGHCPVGAQVGDLYGPGVLKDKDEEENKHHRGDDEGDPGS
jgi:hypothetical protein